MAARGLGHVESMQSRFDLYGPVHKGLRARLFDLGVELDRCDFNAPVEVTVALGAYRRTASFLREHHEHEDHFVDPALQQCSSDLREAVAPQHVLAEKALAELDVLVATIARTQDGRRSAGARLCARYRQFLGDYLQHMNHEETAVTAALWAKYTDAELTGLRARLQDSIPISRFIEWLEILLPAMNIDERTAMLQALKANAPEPTFTAVTGVASRVLGTAGWDAVREQLA